MRVPCLLLAALLAAGCVEPASDDVAIAASDDAPADAVVETPSEANATWAWPPVEVTNISDKVEAGVLLGPICILSCLSGDAHDVDTGGDVTALVAELRWSGPQDLDLVVAPPGSTWDPDPPQRDAFSDEDGLPGQPDLAARVEVLDPAEFEEDGGWEVFVLTKAGADIAYELRLTVFRGVEVPAGYTAFG